MGLNMKAIARKLVELRGDRTQDEIAKELKISISTLGMYEQGRRVSWDAVKIKIAKYYKKSITYIFLMNRTKGRACSGE